MGIGRDILTDLPSLLVIPIALFGVKRLQEAFPDEKPQDIKPLIPTTAPDRPRQRDDGTFFGL